LSFVLRGDIFSNVDLHTGAGGRFGRLEKLLGRFLVYVSRRLGSEKVLEPLALAGRDGNASDLLEVPVAPRTINSKKLSHQGSASQVASRHAICRRRHMASSCERVAGLTVRIFPWNSVEVFQAARKPVSGSS